MRRCGCARTRTGCRTAPRRTGDADLQPIWLTDGLGADEAPNGARFLFLIEGAESAALDRFERVFDLFDGNDPAAVAAARQRWRRRRRRARAHLLAAGRAGVGEEGLKRTAPVSFVDFAPPIPQPIPAPADPAQQRTERHLHMLAELGALGMDLARALHRQAMRAVAEMPAEPPADAPANPPADPALQFARVARAVRQIVALEARLAEDRDTRQERRQAAQARQAADAAQDATDCRKRQIRRRIRPAFKAGCVGRDAQRLLRDLEERLDDDAEDPGQRPLAEVVAHICRDLQLDPNRIPALAGADWTEPDDTAAPDEAGPDKGGSDRGRSDRGCREGAGRDQAPRPLGAASPARLNFPSPRRSPRTARRRLGRRAAIAPGLSHWTGGRGPVVN